MSRPAAQQHAEYNEDDFDILPIAVLLVDDSYQRELRPRVNDAKKLTPIEY